METRLTFCLCAYDFGVKSFNKENANHLIHALQQHFKLSIAWEGGLYCGFKLNLNHTDNRVDIIMPDYILVVLKRF